MTKGAAEAAFKRFEADRERWAAVHRKRRAVFDRQRAEECELRSAWTAGEPGATGRRRGLGKRQRDTAVFYGKLAERGKMPKGQSALRAAARGTRSPQDLLSEVRRMQVVKYTSGHYLSAQNNYVEACELKGDSSETYTLARLVTLCIVYVETWACKSTGLSDLLTRLRHFARAAGRDWITAAEQEDLRSIRMMIERQFPAHTVGAKALTWKELDPLLERLQDRARRGDVYAAQIGAMVLLAHDAMLRGNEYLGRSLLVEDVRVVEAGPESGLGGLVAVVFMTKTRKNEHDERDDTRLAVAHPECLRHCSRYWLKHYLSLANPGQKDVLFPRRSVGGEVVLDKNGMDTGFSYRQFTAVLRKELEAAGVPEAQSFVARSMRSGGHSDYAADGVELPVIGMIGGWKDVQSQARYMRLAKAGLKALSNRI
jgi:hypothetical protein